MNGKTTLELREEARSAVGRMEQALEAVENAPADAGTARQSELEAGFTRAKEEFEKADRSLAVAEARDGLAVPPAERRASPHVRIGREPLTYEEREEDGSVARHSIFRDMYAARHGNRAARERLEAHQDEMQVVARDWVDRARGGEKELRLDLANKAGEGGEIIPPVYLQQKWIALPRASRPIANTLNKQPYVAGTNSINLPKISSGTAVAVQTDGGAVKDTAAKTEEVTAAVQTIAGQQSISQQLLDMSVPGIDMIIYDDLARAYDTEIDVKVITGTETNAKGINEVSGTNSITYTETTPKAGKFYSKLASAIAEVNAGIFLPPDIIAMTPQRWSWILASVDANERPLVLPSGQPGYNVTALQDRVAAENLVGQMMGIPVVIDSSIPKTKGAGTNQDEVYVYRSDQLYLWESTPVLRVLEQTKAEKLEVLAQCFGYYFVMLGRLPKAISKIGGTGLVAPSF
jgi:HK97 family phage major capsid protein